MLSIITNVLAAAIRSGTPILLAAEGEIISEKSGVMNIGLEGLMLIGAIVGFMASQATGSPLLGVLAAMCAGALLSLLHAVLTIYLYANQVISGLALVFIGTGLSSVLGYDMVGQSAPDFRPLHMGPLSRIPVLGPVLFSQDMLVYLAMLLAVLVFLLLNKTRPGLSIRACGDNPQAADAAGLPVQRIRLGCVLLGGVMCGMAGAYMSLAYTTMWQPAMTGGIGWIAVALVIFSQWHPIKAMGGAYLFGGITALQLAIQIGGVGISAHVLQMVPYLFTIVVLVVSMWRLKRKGGTLGASVGPASLGIPYSREN